MKGYGIMKVKIFRADDYVHLERQIQDYLDMVDYHNHAGGQGKRLLLRDIKYAMATIEKIDVVTHSALLIFDEE